MKARRNIPIVLIVCVVCVLFITIPAYGYIDPNAAGLLSQIITPLIVAAAAGYAFFRKQVSAVFSSVSRRLRRRADV